MSYNCVNYIPIKLLKEKNKGEDLGMNHAILMKYVVMCKKDHFSHDMFEKYKRLSKDTKDALALGIVGCLRRNTKYEERDI